MSKAYEVMTHTLATCAPDANVAHVATIMRDRDVGDVLVVEDGNLRGIVTDRDLALQALTSGMTPENSHPQDYEYQSRHGKVSWSLKRVAKSMAKHKIRRLPIVQDDHLVGISHSVIWPGMKVDKVLCLNHCKPSRRRTIPLP